MSWIRTWAILDTCSTRVEKCCQRTKLRVFTRTSSSVVRNPYRMLFLLTLLRIVSRNQMSEWQLPAIDMSYLFNQGMGRTLVKQKLFIYFMLTITLREDKVLWLSAERRSVVATKAHTSSDLLVKCRHVYITNQICSLFTLITRLYQKILQCQHSTNDLNINSANYVRNY